MTECYDRIPFLISPLFDDRDQYFYWVTSGWITTTVKERFTCLWYWNYTAPNVELVFQRYLGETKSANGKIKDRVLLSYSTPYTVSAFFQRIQKHRDQLLKIHVSEDFLYGCWTEIGFLITGGLSGFNKPWFRTNHSVKDLSENTSEAGSLSTSPSANRAFSRHWGHGYVF